MIASSEEVVTMWEDLGMDEDSIAEEMQWSRETVVQCLAENSVAYRKTLTNEEKKDIFTDQDFADAIRTMANLARGAESESVAFQSSKYVIDEIKGRNDARVIRHVGGNQVNFNIINQQIEKAQAIYEKCKQQKTLPDAQVDTKANEVVIDAELV